MARRKRRKQMHYVVVPKDVQIINKKTNEVVKTPSRTSDSELVPLVMKHSDFVVEHVTSHPDFSKGGAEGLRRKKRVENAFIDCKPGDVIGIEAADFKIAKPLFDKIEWHPQFVRFSDQMLPHFEAWEVAEKQDEEWFKKREQQSKNGKVIEMPPDPAAA